MRSIDLTGQKYGLLTVIEREKTVGGKARWRCLCECGNEHVVNASDLRSGNTKSCGCLNRATAIKNIAGAKRPVINLAGRRFGRLVAVEQVSESPAKWLCKCDCGNTAIVRGDCLRIGRTKSCGCLAKETQSRIGSESKGRPSKRLDDLTGRRFGLLTVLSHVPGSSPTKWNCICDCGKKTITAAGKLKSGLTRSCGCLGLKHATEAKIKHNGTGSALFNVHNSMKQRCTNPAVVGYRWYGAKGVKVCDEWLDFGKFREWAEAHGYAPGLTIDRIDPDKDYCPDNCRWITRSENSKRAHHAKKK
jgi:hypothetical protein